MEEEVSVGRRPRVTVEWDCCCQGAHARTAGEMVGSGKPHPVEACGRDWERSGVSVMGGKVCGECVMMLLLLGHPSTPGLT